MKCSTAASGSAIRRMCVLLPAAAGTVLIARLLAGPFTLWIPVRSAANPEGWAGLAVTAALLLGSRPSGPGKPRPPDDAVRFAAISAGLMLLTALAFWPAIHFYFLSDDFLIVRYANTSPPGWTLFTAPGGDGFYRPLGNLSLAATAIWAGYSPVAWHVAALAIHAANVWLVWRMSQHFFPSQLTSGFAAALFAIHGTRPEAVAWIAGRFDLVATFFFLCGLWFYLRSNRRRYLVASLICMILAILSKESAYLFPLVLLLFPAATRMRKTTLPFFAAAILLFAHRIWLFGGLGGYQDPHQAGSQALTIGLSTIKTLALRLWMALYFPIDWSVAPGVALTALAILYLGALLILAAGRPAREKLLFGFGFLAISIVPPLHLLGIDDTLANSRLLYLPSVGFAWMLAAAIDCWNRRLRWLAAGAILLFHFAALEHNLNLWADASAKARAVSDVASTCGQGTGGRVVVAGALPGHLRGVPFFANGLEELLAIRNHSAAAAGIPPQTVTLGWNHQAETASCPPGSSAPTSTPPPDPPGAPGRPHRSPKRRARTGGPKSSRHAGTNAAPAPSG